MTATNYPTDWMDNPDGRDYHYRFRWNNEEARKLLKYAGWKNRMIEMYPKDMKHLRTKIDHVTLKTYDHKGHIKGMRKYSVSPKWEKVPYSRGKMEMKNANGGGTKIKAEVHTGEKWGTVTVDFCIDATPTEVKDAFENGVNEDAISREIGEEKGWAVEDKIDELREELWEYQDDCNHDHVLVEEGIGPVEGHCEDCNKQWQDGEELLYAQQNDDVTVVGTIA